MAVEVVMPKFGLTMQEGTIQRWFKAEGDPIAKGESLFEVETEKVLYEVEAPIAGRVAKLLYPEEATVACARVVAVLAVGDEDPAAVAARYAAVPATATAAAGAAVSGRAAYCAATTAGSSSATARTATTRAQATVASSG